MINQQTERDRNVALYTNVDVQIENAPNKKCSIPVQQTDTYDMPTPEHSDQLPIPITQDESYDANIDDGIQQQNKNSTQTEYKYKIIMGQLVSHKLLYIPILETPFLTTQRISYLRN